MFCASFFCRLGTSIHLVQQQNNSIPMVFENQSESDVFFKNGIRLIKKCQKFHSFKLLCNFVVQWLR